MNTEVSEMTPPSTVQEESDLPILGHVLRRQWKTAAAISATVALGAAGATTTTFQSPQYESEMLILLYQEASVPQVKGIEGIEQPQSQSDLSTEIEILKSRSLVERVISAPENTYDNLTAEQIIGNMSIKQSGKSDVLIVSYKDKDPARAQAVLKDLGETYIKYSLERQRSQATQAIKLIKEKLPIADRSLRQSATSIQRFREQHNIADPEAYATEVSTQRDALKKKAQEVGIVLNQTQSRYEALRQQLVSAGQNPDVALLYATLSQDPVYQDLVAQLNKAEANYRESRIKFTGLHPAVQDLADHQAAIRRSLQERARQVLGSAIGRVDVSRIPGSGGGLTSQLAQELLKTQTELAGLRREYEDTQQAAREANRLFHRVPRLQLIYTELQRNFKARSESVNYLLGKLQELEVAEAQEKAPWEILQSPYLPKTSDAPSPTRNLVLGVLAGAILGSGVALLRERLDRRLKVIQEVKLLTRVPLLGAIPYMKSAHLDAFHQKSRSAPLPPEGFAYVESLRLIATKLGSLRATTDIFQVIGLTSAIPGEGKSTIAYYLAKVLSDLGLRVLLIDADMRKPTVHLLAGISNEWGVSTFLMDEVLLNGKTDDIVYRGEGKYLDILPSGPIPDNPIALLESERMSTLLEVSRQKYDYVLIDTPPMIGIADAQSLGRRVDAMLLVVAIEQATREEVTQAVQGLQEGRCHLVGAIVNRVKTEHGYRASPYYKARGKLER